MVAEPKEIKRSMKDAHRRTRHESSSFHMTPPLQLEPALIDALEVTPEVPQQLLEDREAENVLWC